MTNPNKALWEKALPAAKLGADVLGIDIARNLVEAGNRRAKEPALRPSSSTSSGRTTGRP